MLLSTLLLLKRSEKNLRQYHIMLRLSLIVSKQTRLQHEIPHMDVGSADLPPSAPHHPSLVHHLRCHHLLISTNSTITLSPSHTTHQNQFNFKHLSQNKNIDNKSRCGKFCAKLKPKFLPTQTHSRKNTGSQAR